MGHINFQKPRDFAAYGRQDVVRYFANATKPPRAAIDSSNLISQYGPPRCQAAGKKNLSGPRSHIFCYRADDRGFVAQM